MIKGWFDKFFVVTMLVMMWVWIVILVMLIFNICGMWGGEIK